MKIILFLLLNLIFLGQAKSQEKVNIKCMLELTEYQGEGAYLVVSLLDKNENYLRTLQVFGKEKRWYKDLPYWFRFYSNNEISLDAMFGASISSNQRKVFLFTVLKEEMNSGKIIRFESSVEDNNYHEKDIQVGLKDSNIGVNIPGLGYIKHVKFF